MYPQYIASMLLANNVYNCRLNEPYLLGISLIEWDINLLYYAHVVTIRFPDTDTSLLMLDQRLAK